jgi:hypothetical protein
MSDADQVARLDVVVGSPGSKETLDATSASLRSTGQAAVENAQAIDRNTAAFERWKATQTAAQTQAAAGTQAINQMTAAQRSLAEQGVSLERVLAAVNGETVKATATNAQYVDSTRRATLTQMEAIEMDRIRTASINQNIYATRAMALAQMEAIAMDEARAVATETTTHVSHSALIGIGELTRGFTKLATSGEAGAFAIKELAGGTARIGAAIGGLAAFAGLAVIGFGALYEIMHKAQKEQDELTKSLEKWYRTQQAGGSRREEIEAERKKLEELRREYDRLTTAITNARNVGTQGAAGATFTQSAGGIGSSSSFFQSFTGGVGPSSQLFATTALTQAQQALGDQIAKTQAIIKAAQEDADKEARKTADGYRLENEKLKELILAGNASSLAIADINIKYEAMAAKAAIAKDASADLRKEIERQIDLAATLKHEEALIKYLNSTEYAAKQAAARVDALNLSLANIGGIKVTPSNNPLAGLVATSATILQTTWEKAHPDLAKEQKYVQDMDQIWRRGIESIATRGLQSFTSFFDSVLQLFRRTMDRMEQEGKKSGLGYRLLGLASAGVGGGLAGYQIGQQTSSTDSGIFGGAAAGAALGSTFGPWGAAIGGLTGAAGGLLGAADAQKQAAEAMREAVKSVETNVVSFIGAGSGGNGVINQIAQINDTFTQLATQLRVLILAAGASSPTGRAYSNQLSLITTSRDSQIGQLSTNFLIDLGHQFNALSGPAGELSNAIDEINKKYQENVQTARALGLGEAGVAEATDIFNKSIQQLKNNLLASAKAGDDYLLGRLGENASDPFKEIRDAIEVALKNGFTDVAASLTQTLQIDEREKAYLDAQDAIKAEVQRQTDIQQIQVALLEQQQQTLQKSLQAQQQAVQNLQNVVTTLRNASDSLKLGSLTNLLPGQQLAESRRQLDVLVAQARGGDLTAANGVPQAIQTFLGISRGYYASSLGYQRDFDYAQGVLSSLGDQFGQQLDTQQQMLQQLQNANDKLTVQIALQQQANQTSEVGLINQLLQKAYGSNAITDQYGATYNPVNPLIAQLTAKYPGLSVYSGNGYAPYVVPGSIPGFASGGDFSGGVMRVGEHGPELLATGPARVHTPAQMTRSTDSILERIEDMIDRRFETLIAATRDQTRRLDKTPVKTLRIS